MSNIGSMVKKSTAASLMISLGVYGLLKTDYSQLSMVLFAFGLFTICKLELNLFTGKCGFVIQNKNLIEVLEILAINLISGYVIGMIFSLQLHDQALGIVSSWDCSINYFIRSILCGVIMYLAVLLYKKGTPLGIFFGIPLFIMCGFQHSIANIIIMGVSLTFNPAIIICIIGNWVGSLITSALVKQ